MGDEVSGARQDPQLTPESRRTHNDRAQTFDRGLQVLMMLGHSEGDLSVSEIADELGMHRQSVYRLLGTLEHRKLAIKSGRSRYRLGLAAAVLAGSRITLLQEAVRPILRELAETSSATAFLTLSEGDEAVAVAVEEPKHTSFHMAFRTGSRLPITQGAGAIAILAGRPASDSDFAEVRQARARGYAVTVGQVTPGAVGVSAPVSLPPHGPGQASIGLVTLADGADIERLATRVLQAARRLTDELGR